MPPPWRFSAKTQFVFLFLCAFAYSLLWYLAYYPGSFAGDCLGQYETAVSNHYNDWHPALQILIAYKLPLLLTGQWAGSIILFQILLYSLVLSYMACTLLQSGHPFYAILSFLYILLNPRNSAYMMMPLKDISFAIFSLLMMTQALQIFLSHGIWLEKRRNLVFFALTSGIACFLRHNGILFTIPLLLASCLYVKRRFAIRALLLTAAIAFCIKVPLYTALHVEKPGSRQLEMLGLPMTVIGNVATESPQALDREDREFVYAVAPQEVWDSTYVIGTFNRVKFSGKANLSVIDQAPLSTVFRTLLHCFQRAPAPAFQALFDLTGQVYFIDGFQRWDSTVQEPEDAAAHGLEIRGNTALASFWNTYAEVLNAEDGVTKYLFGYIGVTTWLLIGTMLFSIRPKSLASWKKISLCLPLLCYDFGTMLLLTGQDKRFFLLNFYILPLLLFILCADGKGADA